MPGLPPRAPLSVAVPKALHGVPRRSADPARRRARLRRLPPRPRSQRRRRSRLRELPREAAGAAAHRRYGAHRGPSGVHGLPRTAPVRSGAGPAVHRVPPRSPCARRPRSRAMHHLPRAARRHAPRMHELPRQAGRSSREATRTRRGRWGQPGLRRMPSAPLGRARDHREGRRMRDLSSDHVTRDRAVPRLPCSARRQAAAQSGGVRSLSLRSLALGSRQRSRRLRHLPRRPWRDAGRPPCAVCRLSRRPRRDGPRHRSCRLHQLPRDREPRAPGTTRRVRQLPPRRGELCAERPSGVRRLPQAPRTTLGDPELRELSRREGADAARSRARLRDLPSPARPQRSCQPSELRDLPCQADATRPASRREPSALRDLPRAPRSCAAKRSGDLPVLSSRPAASRADRHQLRELPPVPQMTC